MKHLRYNCLGTPEHTHKHPMDEMEELGITYQHATPQSISDQWWFWNCENIPNELPKYITELEINPMDQIGYGLSEAKAKEIINYKRNQP